MSLFKIYHPDSEQITVRKAESVKEGIIQDMEKCNLLDDHYQATFNFSF